MTNVVASFYSSSIGLEVMDKSAFCLFCAVLALLEVSIKRVGPETDCVTMYECSRYANERTGSDP